MYEYKFELDRVVDGDTVDVIIDLGFDIKMKQRVRLLGIDAPEVRTKDLEEKERGKAASKWLEDTLNASTHLVVRTKLDKRGKYGRVLGTLLVNGANINELMVIKGHAVENDYA